MKMRFILLLLSIITVAGCKKVLLKNQFTNMDGQWVVSEQRILITMTNGAIRMDTTITNAGHFHFKKYTRKENREYKRADYFEAYGEVSYSMMIPQDIQPGQYLLFPELNHSTWYCEQIIGLKPKFHIQKGQWEVLENSNSKVVLEFDFGAPTIYERSVMMTLTLERP